MGRYIDADELLQEFETENVAHGSDLWHITGIKAFIDNSPTAYDVEKVVEEIKDYSFRIFGEIRTENIIKIVRKGGVE